MALMRLYVVAVTVLLMLKGATGACDGGNVNGCSIPGNLPFPYKNTFREACNKHDVCYGCGMKFRVDKNGCDRRFLNRMNSICNSHWATWHCRNYAKTYYLAVQKLGDDHYPTAPEYYCNEAWVRGCI